MRNNERGWRHSEGWVVAEDGVDEAGDGVVDGLLRQVTHGLHFLSEFQL